MVIRKKYLPKFARKFLRKYVFTDAYGNRMNVKFRLGFPFVYKVYPQ